MYAETAKKAEDDEGTGPEIPVGERVTCDETKNQDDGSPAGPSWDLNKDPEKTGLTPRGPPRAKKMRR